jgi:hypothetical protein
MVKIAFEHESSNTPRIKDTTIGIEIMRHICDRVVWQEGKTMWDIGCVVASILFFYIAIGYATGCDRLGAKEAQR